MKTKAAERPAIPVNQPEDRPSSMNDFWERTGVGEYTWMESRWPDSPIIMRQKDIEEAFYGERNNDPV